MMLFGKTRRSPFEVFAAAATAVLVMTACGDRAGSDAAATTGSSPVVPAVANAPTSASASSPDASSSAPAIAAGAAVTCGKAGLPDCPLQAWMKANVQAYLKAGDSKRLAVALDTLGRHEPKGYPGWSASANAAAKAARAGNLPQVKVECKRCHDELRTRYRSELRSTRLF
jgi:hypothetical protein